MKTFYFYKMCPLKSMHCMIVIILILTLLTFGMVFSMKFKSSRHRYPHNTLYPHNTPYQQAYQQVYPMYDYNSYNPYNNVYGGELDHYRMLFIGTVPAILHEPNSQESQNTNVLCIDGTVDRPLDKSSTDADGQSNFHNIKNFLSRHPNIEYKFLIYDPNPVEEKRGYFMGATIDPSYSKHVINHDLKTGLPSDIGVFDIVYIDTNTLGIIDSFKERDYWIRLFSPLVSKNGCIISDDESVLKSKGKGNLGLLATEVVNTFTGRFIDSTMPFTDKVLDDFIKNVTRHGQHTALLFRVDRPDGKVNLWKDKELQKLKKTWSL